MLMTVPFLGEPINSLCPWHASVQPKLGSLLMVGLTVGIQQPKSSSLSFVEWALNRLTGSPICHMNHQFSSVNRHGADPFFMPFLGLLSKPRSFFVRSADTNPASIFACFVLLNVVRRTILPSDSNPCCFPLRLGDVDGANKCGCS